VKSTLTIAAIACLIVGSAAWCEAAAERQVEPIVLSGAMLPGWSRLPALGLANPYPSGAADASGALTPLGLADPTRDAHNGTLVVPPDLRTGVKVGRIVAFRWSGDRFVEIPVQVDERFPYFLANASSDFSFYSGTDQELTYAWDVESWRKTNGKCSARYPAGVGAMKDPVPTLDDDDEIVLMASDAGGQAPPGAANPVGAESRQEVALVDPLDLATTRYAYLFLRRGGSAFGADTGYVRYQRDPDADRWIDKDSFPPGSTEALGLSNRGYGPNLSGTVCDPGGTVRQSTDRFPRDGVRVSTRSYRWHATGRWMVRTVRVAKPGRPAVYGPDLVDRWKGRAFQSSPDSSISLVGFEDEQVNWEANSTLLGERRGPVRAIREVWGADSGTNVTKTETFYRDAITYRYRLRVHPIPPDGLYTSWDYNHGVAAKYYNALHPDGVTIDGKNDDTGNVDEIAGQPAFFDLTDPTFSLPIAVYDWEQVSGKDDAGSLVYVFEIKGATSAVNPLVLPFYRDDACFDDGTGDDPVRRPWPGEASTDPRVRAGYAAAAGKPYDQVRCEEKQGAWGEHGVHFLATGDTDNAFGPLPATEIDGMQWQFAVPTGQPHSVGEGFASTVIAPLLPIVLTPPSP
jgi:hypothetical protein